MLPSSIAVACQHILLCPSTEPDDVVSWLLALALSQLAIDVTVEPLFFFYRNLGRLGGGREEGGRKEGGRRERGREEGGGKEGGGGRGGGREGGGREGGGREGERREGGR